MRNRTLSNIFKGDKGVWMIFLFLCMVSIVEVYSASSMLSYRTGDFWSPIIKHVCLLVLGFFAMVLVLNTKCKYFKLATIFVLPLSVLGLILVLFMGKVNDGARWLNILGVTIQPSEFAKGALVLAIAQILSAMQTDKGIDKKAMSYVCIVAGFVILPILPENLSTALIIGIVTFMMMIIGGIPAKQLAKLAGWIALAGVLLIGLVMLVGHEDKDNVQKAPIEMTVEAKKQRKLEAQKREEEKNLLERTLHRADTWKTRILSFAGQKDVPADSFDITENPQEGHSKIAIAQSSVLGKGWGNSTEREFLPQAFSDFIYAIIIEEMGVIGGGLVALFYVLLLMRAGVIARRCENTFPALLAIGLALMLVTQAMFNMFVAVGLVPVTGQPLPLISKGGTSSIVNCVYLGVILSISRTAKRHQPTDSPVVKAKAEITEDAA